MHILLRTALNKEWKIRKDAQELEGWWIVRILSAIGDIVGTIDSFRVLLQMLLPGCFGSSERI